MFNNVPNIKKNVARMQVKHLLNINSLDIIWSSFFFLTLNKLLREPVLVQKMKKSAKKSKSSKSFYFSCSETRLLLFLTSYKR